MTEEQRKALKVGDKIRAITKHPFHDSLWDIGDVFAIEKIANENPRFRDNNSYLSKDGENRECFEVVSCKGLYQKDGWIKILSTGDYFSAHKQDLIGAIVKVKDVVNDSRGTIGLDLFTKHLSVDMNLHLHLMDGKARIEPASEPSTELKKDDLVKRSSVWSKGRQDVYDSKARVGKVVCVIHDVPSVEWLDGGMSYAYDTDQLELAPEGFVWGASWKHDKPRPECFGEGNCDGNDDVTCSKCTRNGRVTKDTGSCLCGSSCKHKQDCYAEAEHAKELAEDDIIHEGDPVQMSDGRVGRVVSAEVDGGSIRANVLMCDDITDDKIDRVKFAAEYFNKPITEAMEDTTMSETYNRLERAKEIELVELPKAENKVKADEEKVIQLKEEMDRLKTHPTELAEKEHLLHTLVGKDKAKEITRAMELGLPVNINVDSIKSTS